MDSPPRPQTWIFRGARTGSRRDRTERAKIVDGPAPVETKSSLEGVGSNGLRRGRRRGYSEGLGRSSAPQVRGDAAAVAAAEAAAGPSAGRVHQKALRARAALCLASVAARERETGRDYSYVVRARPDYAFDCAMPTVGRCVDDIRDESRPRRGNELDISRRRLGRRIAVATRGESAVERAVHATRRRRGRGPAAGTSWIFRGRGRPRRGESMVERALDAR